MLLLLFSDKGGGSGSGLLIATGITGSPPVLGTPSISQTHKLIANPIVGSKAVLGTPGLSQGGGSVSLIAAPIVGSKAVLGTPGLSQRHKLTAGSITGSPAVLGAPTLTTYSGAVSLTATGITGSPAILGTPSLTQRHKLTATPIIGSPAVLGLPALSQGGAAPPEVDSDISVSYPGNGTTTRFTVTFPFIDRGHVFVTVQDAPVAYLWASETDIVTEVAPATGQTIRIFRVTPDTEGFAEITGASLLTKTDLNRLRRQLLYLIQERSANLGDIAGAFNAVGNDLAYIGSTRAEIETALDTLTENLETLNTLQNTLTVLDETVDAAVVNIAAETARAISEESALAARVSVVEAAQSGFGAMVTTESIARANTDNSLLAQWTVKASVQRGDGKPVIAGIGLAATANNNTSSSEVILQADRLAFVPASNLEGTTEPLFAAGLVNGAPTFVFNASKQGDQTVPARVFVDGAVVSRAIATVAVTASKIHVHNRDSIYPDPGFRDAAWWGWNSDNSFVPFDGGQAQPVERALRINGGMTVARDFASTWFPRERLPAKYLVRFHVFISTDATGWLGLAVHVPGVSWYTPAPTTTNVIAEDSAYPAINLGTTAIPKGIWTTYEGVLPDHATSGTLADWLRLQFRTRALVQTGYCEVAWEVTRMGDASLVVDGAVTAAKLTVGTGGKNLLQNSAPNLESPTVHWATDMPVFGASWDEWRPRGVGGIYGRNTATFAANAYIGTIYNSHYFSGLIGDFRLLVPCRPGQRLEFHAWLSAHRCRVIPTVFFYNIDGNYVSEGPAAQAASNLAGTENNQNAQGRDGTARYGGFITAPAGAHTMMLGFGVRGVGLSDTYAFISQAYLGEATPNQAEASPWSPGAPSTTVDGGMIKTASVQANRLAVAELSAITANVGLLRTASSGARMEIEANRLQVFDSSGNLRVRLGQLV